MKHVCSRTTLRLIALLFFSISLLVAAPADAVGASLCFPYTPKEAAGGNTILYITNGPGEEAVIRISLANPNGTQAAGPQIYTLASGETKVLDFAQLTTLPAGVHQVVVESTQAIAGAAHIRNSNGNTVGGYTRAATSRRRRMRRLAFSMPAVRTERLRCCT